jgi:3-deoxy-D-manno-octulosonic-acid transferase
MNPQQARRWYTLGWWLALPAVAIYLLARSLRQREYLLHWAERFAGRGPAPAADPARRVIWVHAVSVGETRAAQPLIERLAAHDAQARFVLTHMTPTGRAAGADLARALPGRVWQRYLPYDLPPAVGRFLREVRPSAGILMETEIWPNLLRQAQDARVPVVLANARLSERSAAKARRWASLIAPAAATVARVGAQTEADRARLARIYAGAIAVTGNLKFDHVPPPEPIERGRALRERLAGRAVWLFASTRDGEEAMILEALRTAALPEAPLTAGLPSPAPSGRGAGGEGARPVPRSPPALAPVLLFVPRHPQRFDEVARLLAAAGEPVVRRRDFESLDANARFLLGDSMGEMPMYYAMADVALIGGSLAPLGGQNLIEACACGCPVVFGPHMFNFEQAAADAVAAGAALQVGDAAAALRAMQAIAGDSERRAGMSRAATEFARAHRGATERTVALIEEVMR